MSTSFTDTLITSESANQPQLVIWGTNINVHKIKSRFQEFLRVYIIHDEQEQKELLNAGVDISEPYYTQRLEEVKLTNIFFITKLKYLLLSFK
jgi:hypothetical protein